jgi:hypothetical protein
MGRHAEFCLRQDESLNRVGELKGSFGERYREIVVGREIVVDWWRTASLWGG